VGTRLILYQYACFYQYLNKEILYQQEISGYNRLVFPELSRRCNLAALYITSPYASAGKTVVCAGLGRYLKNDGKKVGFFKPIIAEIKSPQAVDSDTQFMKQVLALKEPIGSLCPVIGGKGKLATKIKQAYAKVAKGKDIVIVEGVWRQRPGGKPAEASREVAEALDAKVIIIEPYSEKLSAAMLNYQDFGEYLLGLVVNKTPGSRAKHISKQLSGVDILGVLPENRALLSLTVGELAEHIGGEILNNADRASEPVESFMLGALTLDSGLDYFGRKDNKVAVVRGDRPDMQLAALETSTRCLVLSGGVSPSHTVLRKAEGKGVPIILVKGDTASTVNSIELALGKGKFNQEKKLSRLDEIMERYFNFKALYKGLVLAH
jgi:BioD-like phosphotransacetylase family protein